MRILLIESDVDLATELTGRLRRSGYEVDHSDQGDEAISASGGADLVLLDLGTPGVDGAQMCQVLRSTREVPIIATSAQDVADRVSVLRAGADDCLANPFGFRELQARIDAVLRRGRRCPGIRGLDYPPLRIDPRSREVTMSGTRVSLTEKEFELLWCLACRPDEVVSRREIMARVWGDTWNRRSRTVDTHVSGLRGKLGDPSWIATVRGVGFRFHRV